MKRNLTALYLLTALAVVMVGASYAAVPLYQLFCQVTGYGGTPKIVTNSQQHNLLQKSDASGAPRMIEVRFDINYGVESDQGQKINAKDFWRFAPPQTPVKLGVGYIGQAEYFLQNIDDEARAGMSTFNVTPQKAGPYFVKTQCFCFDQQSLAAGEGTNMPVIFYIDPEILDDKNMDDVTSITLSYTYYDRGAEVKEQTANAAPAKNALN